MAASEPDVSSRTSAPSGGGQLSLALTGRPVNAPAPVDDFRTFFRNDFHKLVAMAASITGNVIFAEDLAQEAMVRAHDRWDYVRSLDQPGSWVRRVLINLALNRRRRALREARALLQFQPEAPSAFSADTSSPVFELLAELPPRQRAVMWLHFVDDLPVREIAVIVDVAPSTVRTQIKQACDKLRPRLTPVVTAAPNEVEDNQ